MKIQIKKAILVLAVGVLSSLAITSYAQPATSTQPGSGNFDPSTAQPAERNIAAPGGFTSGGSIGGQPAVGTQPGSTGFSGAVSTQPAFGNSFFAPSSAGGSTGSSGVRSFDAFITSGTSGAQIAPMRNQAGTTTTSGTGSVSSGGSFDSFIQTNTSTTSTNSVRAPIAPISTSTFTSTQSNVGGSIYVPYDGPVFTGPGLEGGALLAENLLDDNVSKERDLKELVIGWTMFLLSVAALIAVVALVWAGFLYVTAAGDDSRMETAKKIVIWVFIGILLILAAYAIVNTVMQAAF